MHKENNYVAMLLSLSRPMHEEEELLIGCHAVEVEKTVA